MKLLISVAAFFIILFGVFGILMMGGTGRLRELWEERNGSAWLTFMLPYFGMCAVWIYLVVRWWPYLSG